MQQKNQLLRVLGVVFGLAAVVGSMIGQGILRSPGVVAEATSSPAVIIALWLLAAGIACLNALVFAELGAAIPRAGGHYAFIHRAFGGKVSLLAAFAVLIGLFSAMAYLSFVVGEFLVRLGVGGGELSPAVLALGALALFAAINATGTVISGFSQIVLSMVKGAVLVGLVVVLFAAPAAAPPPDNTLDGGLLRNGWLPLGTALVVVLSTYGGWWNVVFYGEEIKDPGRAVPRALFGGILSVAALYIVINLAFLHVLTPDKMAGSNLVAADAAGVVFGPRGDFLLTCFGVLSVGAVANLNLMSTTRLTFAVARAGILPRSFSVVGRRGTPLRAMMLVVVAAALMIVSGSYLTLISLSESVFLPVMLGIAFAVLALRRKEPHLPRPFKVPWYPWPVYASIVVQLALLVVYIAQNPFYALSGFVLVGAMWAVFQLVARMRGGTGIAGAEVEDLE
ncbi:amino acid permease [Altererythrobacter arenosus]|uniref:Amino acid permease n=1 Tax=Altererythrobacter arenosus TaxID=3032592 RepID=A0ABY8FSL3_9SPHN|nr:amino acid permease [Altererythrobacter sp. CAU 1644]WFL78009.1 amino acid permease [Altererythrobacter sp. CAU 1644]